MVEKKRGWIGVDLDATLAFYEGWVGETDIGAPIWPMVYRVRSWIEQGYEVRIFTARVAEDDSGAIAAAVQNWCVKNVGYALPVTCKKDFGMIECWDDRVVQVVGNTGDPVEGSISRLESQ